MYGGKTSIKEHMWQEKLTYILQEEVQREDVL